MLWVKVDDFYIPFDRITEVGKFYIKTDTNKLYTISEGLYRELIGYMRIVGG